MKKSNSPPGPQAGYQDPKHLPQEDGIERYFVQSVHPWNLKTDQVLSFM